jgi:hypothetical protein
MSVRVACNVAYAHLVQHLDQEGREKFDAELSMPSSEQKEGERALLKALAKVGEVSEGAE